MDKITLGTRKVSIEFPGVKALSDVDFEIFLEKYVLK